MVYQELKRHRVDEIAYKLNEIFLTFGGCAYYIVITTENFPNGL